MEFATTTEAIKNGISLYKIICNGDRHDGDAETKGAPAIILEIRYTEK
jgi:hypothetical protein